MVGLWFYCLRKYLNASLFKDYNIMQQKQKLTLGYWKLRGRAQNLRLLLSYLDIDFDQQSYNKHDDWYQGPRKTLGLDFISLPYLIDGDFKLTETNGIARYVIKSYGKDKVSLLGKTPQQTALVDSIIGLIDDNMAPINNLIYSDQITQKRKKELFIEKISWRLASLVKYLEGKDWLLGYITWADFKFAQYLCYIEGVFNDEYKLLYQHILKQYRQRFNNLPGIKKYYERPDAIKGPFVPRSIQNNIWKKNT